MARHPGGELRIPLTSLGAGGPPVSRIGLGLAALGRPAYITSGRGEDLPERTVAAMRAQTFSVLDAAYEAGIRYVDAARSYGRAEEFLSGWLARPGHRDLVVGSKWGYRYTGNWRLEADQHEVKEHSLAMFTSQLGESRALLSSRLALYQVHSLTLESPLFGDPALLAALGALRDSGVIVGLTTSGPQQADTLRRALGVSVGGQPLFGAAQVTWNLLEPSVAAAAAEAAAAGWAVLVKEALANGRLAPADGAAPGPPAQLSAIAAGRGAGEDAIALAAALGNQWATVVLSGAVTPRQLRANLAALTVGDVPPLDLAEPPAAYWAARAARPWRLRRRSRPAGRSIRSCPDHPAASTTSGLTQIAIHGWSTSHKRDQRERSHSQGSKKQSAVHSYREPNRRETYAHVPRMGGVGIWKCRTRRLIRRMANGRRPMRKRAAHG